MASNIKTVAINVIGLVQGVGFRAYTEREAHKLGLFGFVRNEKDGSVYIEAAGDAEVLDNFIEWCRSGPRFAKVERVIVKEIAAKDFKDFEIHRF